MCYEFSSWHWKARAREVQKAQVNTSANAEKTAAPSPVATTGAKRPEVKQPEKVPA